MPANPQSLVNWTGLNIRVPRLSISSTCLYSHWQLISGTFLGILIPITAPGFGLGASKFAP